MDELFLYFSNKKIPIIAGRTYIIGRSPACDVVLDNVYVSRRHASLEYADGQALLVDLGSRNGTWYEGKKVDRILLKTNSTFRIADCNLSLRTSIENLERKQDESGDTMLFEKQLAAILEATNDTSLVEKIEVLRRLYNRKREKLAELALRDALTGLYNRGCFDLKLAEEIARAHRYEHELSILMIDIDHFKQVNDRYGHQIGDEVLADVARIVRSSLRNTDTVCRYGGEEIVVILPETNGPAAFKVAENCRKRIEAETASSKYPAVTVSIGLASLIDDEGPESLVAAADGALYAAKEGGRNRVVFSARA